MRFLVLAVLVLVMTSPAVWAQQGDTRNFGRVTCPQPVPCPGSGSNSSLSDAALLSLANACVTQYFGYSSPKGFFDDSAGLDASNCFTAIPGVLPKGLGAQLAPACCVVPQATTGQCSLRCELNTTP